MKAAFALAPLLVACYGAAPPRPVTVPLPHLSDDEVLEVQTKSETNIENVSHKSYSCPAGHAEGSPECIVHTYVVAEPVTRTHSTMTLGGAPISVAQFRVLTDRDYDKKLGQLEDLSGQCQHANVPRYVGWGLALAGVVMYSASAYTGKLGQQIGFVSLLGGAGAMTWGYYGYGGKKCNEAEALYRDVNHGPELDQTVADGSERALELKMAAVAFNEGRGHTVFTAAKAEPPAKPEPRHPAPKAAAKRGGGSGKRSLRIR
jgi:hypothetical protein